MIRKIRDALCALGIETYAIQETASESVETFFVRRDMQLKRRTTLTDYTVTVFRPFERDGQRMLGSTNVPVYPGMDAAELRETLSSAWHAAGFVCNPAYALYEGRQEEPCPARSGFAAIGLEQAAQTAAQAIFAADEREDVFVNSAEIFAVHKAKRVITSAGTDVRWQTYELTGEYVIQCLTPRDVETHHTFRFLEPAEKDLTEEVQRAMAETLDRAAASEPPASGTYTVLLSGPQMREFFSYYLDRAAASLVYQKYSTWSVGQNVQGENVRGDRLTLTLAADEPYDAEGIPLRDRPLLQDGVLQLIHGGTRFSRYLGLEPTGAFRAIVVPTGSTPLAELKRKPHLHAAAFSDFQMDSLSGHFGGEIRLGYLYDGRTVRTVTGGSVNGSILTGQAQMVFSAERYRTADYDGPMAVAIQGVAVAGQ